MAIKFQQKQFRILLIIIVLPFMNACKFRQKAELIVHNAKIYTADENFSVAEAMVINDGKILAIGKNDDILKNYESNQTVNAKGKSIFPGFIDAHCHFTGFAADSWKCDLVGTKSLEEVILKIKNYSQSAPQLWIYGRGWDQNDWENNEFPDKSKLDSLFPDRPVFLKRIDGHAALANQTALNLANINENTIIKGGSVLLKNGKPTGILIDNAMDLIDHVIPQISDSLLLKYYVDMQEKCISQGLTGVHDCGVSEATIERLKILQDNKKLKIKIFALLSDSATYYDKWVASGPYISERLHVGGFKAYADGALGSRGACLKHPYSDQANWAGFLLNDTSHFVKIANKLAKSSLQLCTHAIGDSGNSTILKIYANVLKKGNDKRWRIEHAQVVDTADFHYFKDYNIIPSVQPTHATSDMYWAEKRIGADRMVGAYAFQHLLETNNWMPLGTDFPVEEISPFKTFYAAVFRKDTAGFPANGFQMTNALSRENAIKGMTIWAAKGAFEEKLKGSLEVGKSADFILLNNDLMTCKPEEVLKTKVLQTYINGERLYTSK